MKFFKIISLKEIIILVCIVVLAIFFRVHNLEGRMTFEWDQARDFEAVGTMLTTGKPLLLGPIVRGATGGFYLGPLYYYLITPLYFFSGGNPLSLTVLSIGLDVAVICLLFIFIKSTLSLAPAIITSMLWAGSPLIISSAQIPWNVSLIPLWTLVFIITLSKLSKPNRFRYKLLTIFLVSLTANIHLSLVPIAAFFLAINWRSFIKLSRQRYALLGCAGILPVSTLILHDLLFRFENTILLKRFLFGVSTKSANMSEIISLIIEKYGYTIARLYTGEPYTIFGLIIVISLLLYGFVSQRKYITVRYSLLSIVVVLFSLLIYRDRDFAEYYFSPSFIPILILMAYACQALIKKFPLFLKYGVVISVSAVYLYLGMVIRSAETSPYSLTVKKMIISTIRDLGYPVEVRTALPRERNTGFDYLMKQMGVMSDPSARRKAYIYEARNLEVIAPAEARSIILDKPIQAFKLIVFSN